MTFSDDEVWQKFSQTVKPLIPKDRDFLTPPVKKIRIFRRSDLISRSVFLSEVITIGSLPNISVEKYDKSLKKLFIDATLDLHGETIKNAYPILIQFIEKALHFDHRIILIITGKSLGKASTDAPRLVKTVPFWLKSPPLNQYVKKVTYAKRAHGDDGAFYVFLKSFIKK